MEYDASGLLSRRHRGAGFNEVVSAQQRDLADLDQDGSTTDYVTLTPLYDGALDCIGVLGPTGAVAESYVHTYDGMVTITNGAGMLLTNTAVGWHQGFGSAYEDPESQLIYEVYRYYDPAAGRFVSSDPLGPWYDAPNAGNGYAWCGNRYRNGWDPLGLTDLTPEQREERNALLNARIDTLAWAMAVLSETGAPWIKDQIKIRRRIHGRLMGLAAVRLIDDEGEYGHSGGCGTRRGSAIIFIDTKYRTDPVTNHQREKDRPYRENVKNLLTTIVHEFIHDYDHWHLTFHPAVEELGVGAGKEAYDKKAEELVEAAMVAYEKKHGFTAWRDSSGK